MAVNGVASNNSSFTVVPTPSITSLSPTTGPAGTSVTVTGTNFGATQGTGTLTFNGTQATTITSWNATSIVAPVPTGATTGNVVVNASGVNSNGSNFTVIPTPTITSLSPTSGAVAASVTITGTNFGATQGTSTVTFNGTVATPGSWNATSIVVPVPTGATTGNVAVTVGGVASTGSAFTVLPTPSITTVSPTSGVVGTMVTITGTNFGASQGSSAVKFNGTTATPTSWSNGSIVVPVPTGATTGNVAVTGNGVVSNGLSFTVSAGLSITGISPTSGNIGKLVTISGASFGAAQGISTVFLNGTAISNVDWSDTSLGVTVPPGATSGPFSVVVNGHTVNSSSFTVTSQPPPGSWLDQDIGVVNGLTGSTTYSNGTFTVLGAGTGLNGTADSFHFVYQPLSGDGSIVARVVSLAGASSIPQAGVMIRETLNTNSSNAFVSFYPSQASFVSRPTTGANYAYQSKPFGSTGYPYWVKLVRSGSVFTGFVSWDGFNWIQIGTSATVTMAQNAYVGLAFSSQGSLDTATFDGVSIDSVASPAPVISSLSSTTGSIGSQVTISGSNFGATQGGSRVSLGAIPMTIVTWSNTSIVFTVPNGATTGFLVVSVAPTMNDSNAVNFAVTMQPLPSSWQNLDVGVTTLGVAGTATFSGGTYTLTDDGQILGTADALQFVYQPLVGDGSIVARVATLQGGGSTQAGVMIRESLSASSTNAFIFFQPNQAFLYDRPTTGANTATQASSFQTGYYPYWVKLIRNGNVFTGYVSIDGLNWSPAGSATVAMAQSVYAGLALGSQGGVQTATFDNVSINSAGAPAPVISGLSDTTGSVGGQILIAGSGFGNTQGASLVLLNGAPLIIDLWSSTSIVVTIPNGATSGPLTILVAPSMNASNPVTFAVTTQPLPSGWQDLDVGGATVAMGTATYSAGVFTITDSGQSVWGTSDQFHYVYQPLVGDGSIIARVANLQGATTIPQAGVMIRESLSPSSTHAFVFFQPNQGFLYDRPTTGAATTSQATFFSASAYPYWIQLVRSGNMFTAYVSSNGATWTQVGGPTTVVMAPTVYIGLALSSQGGTDTATFDNVSLTLGTTPYISSVSPIVAGTGTMVTINGSNFGNSQGSSTLKFNGVLATSIASWTPSQIVATVPATLPAGTGPVAVVVNSISSNTNVNFTAIHPVLTSLTPPSAAAGGLVTINGVGFTTGVGAGSQIQVSMNGTPALPTSWTDTSLQIAVPSAATSGPVTVTLTGVNAGGVPFGSVSSNSVPFTVDTAPIIGYFNPPIGPVSTPVTIHGSGFGATQSTSSVQFYGVSAAVTSWSDTQIVALVPVGTTSGPISVTVAGLTSTTGINFGITRTTTLTNSAGLQTAYVSLATGGTWYVTDVVGAGCSSCSARGTIHNDYDSSGNMIDTVDQLGHTTNYTYDGSGNVLSVMTHLDSSTPVTTSYTYNSFNEVLTMTDPLGNTTTNTYDPNGNLLTVTSPSPDGGTTPASVTQFAYDTKGELTTITDPLNHVTTLAYFPTGLIQTITDAQNNVTTYGYDARGNRTSVTDANLKVTQFAYDLMNRLTGITYPDNTTASFVYDSRGRRTSATDQNNKTTIYAYDDADRLTSVTDPALNVTQYGYDNENNLLTITDANNHVTTMGYDAYGRVLSTSFPSTLSESYLYDAVGNLTSKTDRKNQTIQYVYDALNRLTTKTYPDTTSANYYYDLASRVYQVNDPTGGYTIAYDNMGRQIGTATQYAFLPGHTYTAVNVYDAASNRTTMQAPDGSTNTYTYDTLNRLSNLASSLTGSFGFGYDALSRRTSLTRPNGITTSYAYDNLSHLLSVLHKNSGGTTLDGATYTYDNAGNRLTKLNALNNVTEAYTYDPLYQLTQVVQGATTTESYSYDAVGNRLSSLGVSPYNYNSSNELTSNSTGSYTYDNNGNTLTDPSGKQYTWDYENRLVQVVVPGTGTVTFKYDPFGRRIQKSSPSGTTNYLYDKKNLLEEVDGSGNVLARHTETRGLDEELAELRASTTSYYETDGLGSTTSLSNSTGMLANTYIYDGYGKLVTSTGTLANPFRHSGREFDSETGIYFDRARYYDPKTGRFISEDPVGFLGGIDKYAFVLNRPINFSDPSGLDCPQYPIDCIHTPDERANMQREHDQTMQNILGPDVPDISPPPAKPKGKCDCKEPRTKMERQERDLETLAFGWQIVEAGVDVLLGTGLEVGGLGGIFYACVQSAGSLCIPAVEAAPAFVVGGYYIQRSGYDELKEIFYRKCE